MKVFYTSSLRGAFEQRGHLEKIYEVIEKLGHTNLDNILLNIANKDSFYEAEHEEKVAHFKRMIASIKKADVVLLEVSTPSLSMGFILQKALEMGKPVIALHLPGKEPFFVQGIEDDKLQVIEYEISDLENAVSAALDYSVGISDVRFNFFINPSIGVYLDWISKHKKIPRSVYLRTLIERDMAENDEYHAS